MRSCMQVENGSASMGSDRCDRRRLLLTKLHLSYRDAVCVLQSVRGLFTHYSGVKRLPTERPQTRVFRNIAGTNPVHWLLHWYRAAKEN